MTTKDITFEEREESKETKEFKTIILNIVKKDMSELNIPTIDKVIVLDRNKIQGFNGSISYNTVNGKTQFILLLADDTVSIETIKYPYSVLHITIYHELSHIQNVILLSKSISITDIPHEIYNYHNIKELQYQTGCVLWSEFYAHFKESRKYSGTIREEFLLKDFDELNTALIICEKRITDEPEKATPFICKHIYLIMYDLCATAAYKTVHPDYDYDGLIQKINKILRVDLTQYAQGLYKSMNICLQRYENGLVKEQFYLLGSQIMLLYDFLRIKVNFVDDDFILFYDETQPYVRWYNQKQKNKPTQ